MCTLDDKLLGEKVHNYCSSSEGEDDDEEDNRGKGGDDGSDSVGTAPPAAPPAGRKYNTGPKGVLADYQHFKEMEARNRKEKVDRDNQIAKNCMTARSHAEEQAEKDALEEIDDDDEEFLESYRQQRMNEIAETYNKANNPNASKSFGNVIELVKDTFLDAIDNEHELVTVVVLIMENTRTGCRKVHAAFTELAPMYPSSKFCVITAAEIGTSLKFKMEALPAILVYKNGDVIGNFVRLCEDLGNDVCVSDLESFLMEHGMLPGDVAYVNQTQNNRVGQAANPQATGWRNGKKDLDDSDDE